MMRPEDYVANKLLVGVVVVLVALLVWGVLVLAGVKMPEPKRHHGHWKNEMRGT